MKVIHSERRFSWWHWFTCWVASPRTCGKGVRSGPLRTMAVVGANLFLWRRRRSSGMTGWNVSFLDFVKWIGWSGNRCGTNWNLMTSPRIWFARCSACCISGNAVKVKGGTKDSNGFEINGVKRGWVCWQPRGMRRMGLSFTIRQWCFASDLPGIPVIDGLQSWIPRCGRVGPTPLPHRSADHLDANIPWINASILWYWIDGKEIRAMAFRPAGGPTAKPNNRRNLVHRFRRFFFVW